MSGNPKGRPRKPQASGGAAARPERRAAVYEAMLHVAEEEDEAKDKTALQRHYRAQFKKDPDRFLTKLADLEKVVLARGQEPAGRADAPEEPEGRDEGTERVMNLLMQQMGEDWDRLQRFEAAEAALGREGLSRLLAEASAGRRDKRPRR